MERSDAEYEFVLSPYDRCWEKSKGRYHTWVPGRLTREELTLYLVMNATSRAVIGRLSGRDEDAKKGKSRLKAQNESGDAKRSKAMQLKRGE